MQNQTIKITELMEKMVLQAKHSQNSSGTHFKKKTGT